ncbi:MAG TPA: MFS transporter, partial [Solirubrobacteraceae bacterium]
MSIVGQSSDRLRIALGAGCVYSVAAFAAALDGGRVPDDPAASVVPFCAAFALGFVPWGRVADRRGAGVAMRAACALLVLAGLVLCAPLGDAGWLAARALEGAAAAGFPPAAQAALAALGGTKGAGRAIGVMSVAVAVGSLLVPLLAGAVESVASTQVVLAVCAVGLPALGLAAVAPVGRAERAAAAPSSRLVPTPGLVAAWACAFLVLIAYWTIVTRAAVLLGPDAAGMTETAARTVPLIGGVAGMVLTGLVARVGDRRGPRRPMIAVL